MLRHPRICQALSGTLLLVALSCGREAAKPPFSAAESIKRMQLADGFKIEPFVTEPDVVSPVAMDIDEDGRIYVVEDRGYPLDAEGHVGRIKLLQDTNGDGTPDRTTLFADKLVMPTGIMRWRKGVLVTDAPDVWYLEDTDGDGKADVKKKVLTGFAFTNPQHTVNGPVYGLDNWIYLAHEGPATAIIFQKFSDRGSDIRFVDHPQSALQDHGRNVRFKPDTFEIEALSSPSQYGHAFDDFGRHFVLNNTYHARYEVIGARYLERNPDLPVSSAVEDISDHGSPAKVYPIAANTRFELLTNVGEFTSACSLTFWRGGALVAEPAHNLVHRDMYSPVGPTFKASRDKGTAEFLASRDPWFRPVNFYAAPDGSLYLIDYYRLVIEHPEWMSEEAFRNTKDLTAGNDRGRIYRITAAGAPTKPVGPIRLSSASPAELVEHLADDNPWWRRTAQRLLVDRKPAEAIPLLVAMAASNQSPVARVHALWTLEGFGKLDDAVIGKALGDNSSGVRENVIRLAEPRMKKAPALVQRLLGMETDTDPRVRFQLLCTLSFDSTLASRNIRDRLLASDFDNHWTQIAALSASPEEATRLFRFAVQRSGPPSVFEQAAAVIGARGQPAEIQMLLASVARAREGGWKAAALEGLAGGLRGKETAIAPAIEQEALQLFASDDPAVRRATLHVLERTGLIPSTTTAAALDRAVKIAGNRTENADLRADAIGLLTLGDPASRRTLFEGLVNPIEPEPVQIAAVRAIGYIPGEPAGQFLLKNWREFTSSVRLEAADALFRDPKRAPMIVAALKAGEIQPWSLAFRHRRQLIMHRDPAIREAARPLLEEAKGERSKVIARYQAALDHGDGARGKAVFESVCAKCHKLNGTGADVGPDLATVRHQPKQVLLAAVLDPNESISQGYEAYVVEKTGGGTLDGVLGPQTSTTLTLRHEEGKEDVIQRKDIKSMHVAELSAMPADLEKQVNVQQMGDLLEYIKTAQ